MKHSGLLLFCFIFVSVFFLTAQTERNSKLFKDSTAFKQDASLPSATKTPESAPVAPFDDTLFYIYAHVGTFSVEERAQAISSKIAKISKYQTFHPDSLQISQGDNVFEIVYDDLIIMSVFLKDAFYVNNTPSEKLAEMYRQKIADAVKKHREQVHWISILKQIVWVILIILALFFAIKYLNRLYRFVRKKIEALKGSKINGISIKSYHLLDAEREIKVLGFLANIIRYVCIAFLLYLSLPLLFSVFPATQSLAEQLFGYILYPLEKMFKGFFGYIPNLITIIVIIFVFRYLVRGLRYLAKEISDGKITLNGFYSDWAMPTFTIAKTILYAFMFILIFPYLPGSDSKVFQGVSVFLGVIISLGSTSLIGNVVSGLVLTYMRPFKVGDYIKIGDITGNIVEKTPFVTRIRTLKNEIVTIPNSNIMSSHTVNYSSSAREEGVILHTSVTIGYDAPWRQVHQLLLTAATKTAHLQKKPAPFVLQIALNDFYVEYQINAYTQDENLIPKIYSELHQNIQDVFNEAGVEIMSPHYRAERDGNQITIPEEFTKTTSPSDNTKSAE